VRFWRSLGRLEVCLTIGGEGEEAEGMGGEFGLGGEEADEESDIFGFAGLLPGAIAIAGVTMQPLGGDVLGKADLSGLAGFVVSRKVFGEPVGDAADDLADTSLGDFQLFGGLAGA